MERSKSHTALWAILGVVLIILAGCLAYILVTQYNDYKADGGNSAQVDSTPSVTVPPTAAPTEVTTQEPTQPSSQPADAPAATEEQARTIFQAAQSAYTDIVNSNNTLPDEADYFYGSDAEGIGFETAQKLGTSVDPALLTVFADAQGVQWISYNGSVYTADGDFME